MRTRAHLVTQNTINSMTMVSFGVGNIIGTEIFQPKDAPAYIPGKIAILVLLTAQIFVCYLLRWINIRMNKNKQAALEEMKSRNGWTEEDVRRERERHAFMDLTDRQYVLLTPFVIRAAHPAPETLSSCTFRKLYSSHDCSRTPVPRCIVHIVHLADMRLRAQTLFRKG